jgi:NADH:ubiquinone oxidoreductase subunit 3 (subunit A)
MFFVVFDLEAVFVYAWAGAARELGWAGYWGVVLFVATLAAALLYVGYGRELSDLGIGEFVNKKLIRVA